MKIGTLIVIEGGDSSGKATQTRLLRERLQANGHMVAQMDFPRYVDNRVGALIRECLDGKHGDFIGTDPRIASVLYAADRRESLSQITQWLNTGHVVILDRYTSANLLHQGAKLADPKKRREVLEWIYQLEHEVMSLPVPDLLLYLHVPASARLELLRQQQKDGYELDQAERNARHQEQVDGAAADMLSMYSSAVKIECMEGNSLLSRETIADTIETHVRAIIEF